MNNNETQVNKSVEEVNAVNVTSDNVASAKTTSTKPKKNSFLKSKYFKIASVIFAIIISIIIFLGVKSSNLITKFENSVYPESYVLGTDISGLTKEELHSTLENMIGEIGNTKIKVNIGEKTFENSYKDIDVTIPYDEFENEILAYGKDKSFFEKLDLLRKPEKKDYEFAFSYNEDKFNEFLAVVSQQVNVAPVNATIDISGGSVRTTGSSVGYKLNSEELLASLKEAMKDISHKEEIVFDSTLLVVNEAISQAELQTVKSKVSTFTTTYPQGPSGTNLEIAAKNIDNTLLMPGESFSCETAIGPTTPENNFVMANTYVGGKVVKNYGGGVCQVSSTLYNTMLKAGIIPYERLNHMMPVSYVPIGLDATLADGAIDLRFKNEFDFPIVINSFAGNGSLTIEFWSDLSVLKGYTYEPKSVKINSLSADAFLVTKDANGNVVSEQFLDRSTYQPLP
ncbi:MAG: VanW family protein [Clostridium sp.]